MGSIYNNRLYLDGCLLPGYVSKVKSFTTLIYSDSARQMDSTPCDKENHQHDTRTVQHIDERMKG